MLCGERGDRRVEPILAVVRVRRRVLLVERQGGVRHVEPTHRGDDATAARPGLALDHPEAADHLGLQRTVGGEVSVERLAFQRFDR